MLCQPRGLAEGARRVHIIRVCVGIPAARFQQIDLIRSLDDVRKTPADCAAHLPLLMLHVQRNDRLSRLQKIQQKQLHKETLGLPGISEDEDIGAGLVLVALVEIDHDVAAALILADIKAFSVCLAGVVERKQICHRTGGQHPFIFRSERIIAAGTDAAEALLLAQLQLGHIEFCPCQLYRDLILQDFEFRLIRCDQLHIDRAVHQGFLVAVHGADERFDILQITLGLDRLLDVLCAVPLHAVADLGVVDDPAFLQRRNNARINVQRYAVHLT